MDRTILHRLRLVLCRETAKASVLPQSARVNPSPQDKTSVLPQRTKANRAQRGAASVRIGESKHTSRGNSKNASVAVRPLVLKTEVDQLDIGSERHRVASRCKSSFLLRQPNGNSEGLPLSNLGFASSVISLVGDGVDPNNEETDSVDRS
jgi:hypothetical protein